MRRLSSVPFWAWGCIRAASILNTFSQPICNERAIDMPAENIPPKELDRQAEHVRMYYENQYARTAKLEDQRLAITNIVITLSVIAFTFGFSNPAGLTTITGIGLPTVMVIANIFAIIYIQLTYSVIRVHLK